MGKIHAIGISIGIPAGFDVFPTGTSREDQQELFRDFSNLLSNKIHELIKASGFNVLTRQLSCFITHS